MAFGTAWSKSRNQTGGPKGSLKGGVMLDDILDAYCWQIVDRIERALPWIAIPLATGLIGYALYIIITRGGVR